MSFLSYMFRQSIPAVRDLAGYLSEAVLPQMLCGPHEVSSSSRPRNELSVDAGTYRELESVRRFRDDCFNESCKLFTGQIALGTAQDAQDADEETGSRVIIPCGPRFNVPPLHLIRPNNMRRFASWIDQLPLATVQRVHHITHGDSHYRFHEHQDALDDDVFQYFTWSGGSMDGTLRTSLVVAVQPVWAVEEVVLHVMSNADTYSMPASPTEAGALTPPNQLWAKLYDLCMQHNCQYFVLTTYNAWLFGGFSGDMRRGFISHLKKWDDRSPTIIQMLCYWLASSMGQEGGYLLPPCPPRTENVAHFENVLQPILRTIPSKSARRCELQPLRIPGAHTRHSLKKGPRAASMPFNKRFNDQLFTHTKKMEAVAASAKLATVRSRALRSRSPPSPLDNPHRATCSSIPTPPSTSPQAYSRPQYGLAHGPSPGGTWEFESDSSPDGSPSTHTKPISNCLSDGLTAAAYITPPWTPASFHHGGTAQQSTSGFKLAVPDVFTNIPSAEVPAQRNKAVPPVALGAPNDSSSPALPAVGFWIADQMAAMQGDTPHYVEYPLTAGTPLPHGGWPTDGLEDMPVEDRVLAFIGLHGDCDPPAHLEPLDGPLEVGDESSDDEELSEDEDKENALPSHCKNSFPVLDTWSDGDSFHVEDDAMWPSHPEGDYVGNMD